MNGSAEGELDAWTRTSPYKRKPQVLKSDSLALEVIKDLNLEQNQDSVPNSTRLVGRSVCCLHRFHTTRKMPAGECPSTPHASPEDLPNQFRGEARFRNSSHQCELPEF